MISKQAGRALDLIQGIEVCKQADEAFWRGVVTRIVYDLDEEPGGERMMVRVADLLARIWDKLEDKPPVGS